MLATDIDALCKAREWSRTRLIHELRRTAHAHMQGQLPADESLKRMIRLWSSGSRALSPFYAELLTGVFGAPFRACNSSPPEPPAPDIDERARELVARVGHSASTVDGGLVIVLEQQTAMLRTLDRRLGASHLLTQTGSHVDQITDLLTYCLPGGVRSLLAAAGAEAAALAGWQALDLGDPARCWRLHDVARSAARDSDNQAVLAHVTAQQAYALLDVDRAGDALSLVRHARQQSESRVPALLTAWLWAAEAEATAATGDDYATRTALDQAAALLPDEPADDSLPFLFLDRNHLGRWRGHCLARLGSIEAIEDLTGALNGLTADFARAAAGLRCDLALVYSQRGDHSQARAEAAVAQRLASQTASARQQRRIDRLLLSGAEAHQGR